MTTCCLTLLFSPGNFLPKITWLSFFTHLSHLIWPPVTFLCFPNWRYYQFDII
jgi:hypothetical protein